MLNGKHFLLIGIIVVVGFIAFMAIDSSSRAAQTTIALAAGNAGCGPSGCTGMPIGASNVKEFIVVASKFKFEPSTLTVNKGDRVRLTLKSADVSHGLGISEFGVNLAVGAGEQKTMEFTADKEGTFNFACSVYCGSGHLEMSGKLIVKGAGSAQADGSGQALQPSAAVQQVTLRATPYGYDNPTIRVKAGQPVKFDFSADPQSGCGRQVIIDNVGINLVSKNGETVSATFTPPKPGTYKFHCSMNMFRGELIAV